MPFLHLVTLVLINLTHHWFYILRAVVDLFSLKNPWKLFHHEINYENFRTYHFYGKPINRYHKCLISSSFFNFIWILCRLFSRIRTLKHCKYVIWSDTWRKVWPKQLSEWYALVRLSALVLVTSTTCCDHVVVLFEDNIFVVIKVKKTDRV